MFAAFSTLTLLLAAVGVYGVMQYLVARRRRELAVRVALCAGSRAVIGLMLARGLKQALAGIAIGVAAAAMLMRGVAGSGGGAARPGFAARSLVDAHGSGGRSSLLVACTIRCRHRAGDAYGRNNVMPTKPRNAHTRIPGNLRMVPVEQ